MGEQIGLPGCRDRRGLAHEDISADLPVTLEFADVQTTAALRRVLADRSTWIADADALLITSHDVTQRRLQVKAYDVCDLVLFPHQRGDAGG